LSSPLPLLPLLVHSARAGAGTVAVTQWPAHEHQHQHDGKHQHEALGTGTVTMTERLYYTDPLLTTFDATVRACEPAGEGKFAVILDRTAFYPTSGGQPFDTGRLGAARVVDVVDDDAGEIRHVVETSLAPGARVKGDVDWGRRFDHMQQHTGQHVLSAAFDRLYDVRTTSFHLGAEVATIDLAREMTSGEIARAEAEANRVVWEDRPVIVRFVSEDEAAKLPLRKDPARTGTLRLVEVADFDLSACGGTHVPALGRIGIIAVSAWERFKGGSRVTFVCGNRALRAYGTLRDIMSHATKSLSIAPADLGATLERLVEEQKGQSRLVRRLQTELAVSKAVELRAAAQDIGGTSTVLSAQPGYDGAALKTLATAIVEGPGLVTILVGDGQPAAVVVARSADISFDAGAWMKSATSALGGRGGGRPELAQGGLAAAPERILAYARESMTRG
jgi:alanyl-tRNA synthetase